MKRWGRYSWGSDETKLISAILEAAERSEAAQEAAEDESRDRAAPEESARTAKELHSARTGAR